MKARGFLKLCISFSQSLPNTLELESASFPTYASLVTDCCSEFQVEIDWSTASLGIWLSADLVRLSFPELGVLSTTVHRDRGPC